MDMTEHVENLMLEHLRGLRASQDGIVHAICGLQLRVSSLAAAVLGTQSDLAFTHQHMRFRANDMGKLRFVYWQDDGVWLGYLEAFPDYMTQGESRDELEENLRDIYKELTSDTLPLVRRVGELDVA